jgi:nitrite reductase/ring-hydroxylating ferredoxin subunit
VKRTESSAQDGKLSRRRFNKVSLAGLATLPSGVWVFLLAGCGKTYPQKTVGKVDEIPVGGSKLFTYPTDVEPCFLLRPANDTYVAYSRICTHLSCPLFYQPDEGRLNCPCHGGAFSVADGSVLQGPPRKPLPRVILERRGDELVATGMSKT